MMLSEEKPKEKPKMGIDLNSAVEVVIVNNTISSLDEFGEPAEPDQDRLSQK